MFNLGLLAGRAKHPVGEVTLTASAGSWVCPPGVTRVSVVLVGRGGDGRANSWSTVIGGGGGALTYKNDHVVVPGQTYTWQISQYQTVIFGLVAAAGSEGQGNGSGGSGAGGSASPGTGVTSYAGGNGQSGGTGNGGSAGTYTGPGTIGGETGISLTGNTPGTYGKGGRSGTAALGQPGGIRIIWGSGRSFPNNAA